MEAMNAFRGTVHAVKKLTVYRRTVPTAMGVLCLRLWVYYDYGYGRIAATSMGMLQAYYRHTIGMLWGARQPLVTTAAIVKGKSND